MAHLEAAQLTPAQRCQAISRQIHLAMSALFSIPISLSLSLFLSLSHFLAFSFYLSLSVRIIKDTPAV